MSPETEPLQVTRTSPTCTAEMSSKSRRGPEFFIPALLRSEASPDHPIPPRAGVAVARVARCNPDPEPKSLLVVSRPLAQSPDESHWTLSHLLFLVFKNINICIGYIIGDYNSQMLLT